MIKSRFSKWSMGFSYALIIGVIGLAAFSPFYLMKPLAIGMGLLVVFGLLNFLLTVCIHKGPILSLDVPDSPLSLKSAVGGLWLGQVALLFISGLLFYFFEFQSQENSRFPLLENGYFLQIIQQHTFSLGFGPWLLYAILGIGLAYFNVCVGKNPLLFKKLFANKKQTHSAFLMSFLNDVFNMAALVPFIFVTILALVCFCEAVNTIFGWDTLFLKPLRTIFICSLVIIIFRKKNKELINYMRKAQLSVGSTFMIYIFAFSFFILWLHGTSDYFTLGLASGVEEKAELSRTLKYLTPEGLHSRLSYLIVGWWLVWLPWMASLVARAAIGASLWRALIQSSVIPLIFFGMTVPSLSNSDWIQWTVWLKLPGIQILGTAVMILYIKTAWGKMYTVGDVSRGAMVGLEGLTKRPLDRWMERATVSLACYILAWFMLGWFPMQLLVTIGIVFVLAMTLIYLSVWVAWVFRRLGTR